MSLKEKMKEVLKYAVLAPSTHNTQPWFFKITENTCQLFFDTKYHLSQADPEMIYFYISLGCCLENLIIAAKYFNIYKGFKFLKPVEGNPIAEVFFEEKPVKSQINSEITTLFNTISIRKTQRGIFSSGPIPSKVLSELAQLNTCDEVQVSYISDKNIVRTLSSLTAEGVAYAYKQKPFRTEMAKWINNALSKKRDGMPTYSLGIPWYISFFVSPGIRFFNLSPVLSKINFKTLNSAPLHCVVSVKKNSVNNWLKAGRISERVILGMQANNLQTFIAIAATFRNTLRDKVKEVLKLDYIPVFLFAGGHMKSTQPLTTKHFVENKLIDKLEKQSL